MAKAIACTQFPEEYIERLLGKRHAGELTLGESARIIEAIGVHSYDHNRTLVVCGTTAERKKARERLKDAIKDIKHGESRDDRYYREGSELY